MSDVPGILYLASAGTGKTFRLTGRLIALYAHLAERDDEPSRALAMTFTRKASGEIFDRTIRRLLAGAKSADEARKLTGEIETPITREHCARTVAWLARNLGSVRTETIDAFLNRAAGELADELGLPPGWRVGDADEQAALREQAVTIAAESWDRRELGVLMRAFRMAEARSSILGAFARAVDSLAAPFHEAGGDPALWDQIQPKVDPTPERLAACRDAVAAMDLPKTKQGKVNANWAKVHTRLLDAIDARHTDSLIANGLLGKLAEGADSYYKYPLDEFLPALEPVLAWVRDAVAKRAQLANNAAAELLTRYATALMGLRAQTGVYDFADVPDLLLASEATDDAGRFYDAADARFDHLLLDEFQDTSMVQFRLLRPMLDELLGGAGGRSVFVVGDTKQSLYGWRSAEAELLPTLPLLWDGAFEVFPMAMSYRSSPAVLDTVNAVFGSITTNPAMADFPGEAARFAERFDTHEAAKARPGLVRLTEHEIPDDADAETRNAAMLDAAAERVYELTRDHPGASIGVLVRRNSAIPRVIQNLRLLGIPASEEGGNPLTDAPTVLAALSLLRFAEHPGDTLARFHAASTAVGAAVGLGFNTPDDDAARIAEQLRARLLAEGFAAALASLAPHVHAGADGRGSARFDQLVDLAVRADRRGVRRVDDFVRLVERVRVDVPGESPVRVMTIHASKGLEFDCVVLPELHTPLKPTRTDALIEREGRLGPPTACSLAFDASTRAHIPRLAAMYEAEVARVVGDGLCILYVAMTRARRRLEMLVPAGKPRGAPTFACVLRGALAPGDAASPVLYEHGVGDLTAISDVPETPGEEASGDETSLDTPEPAPNSHPATEGTPISALPPDTNPTNSWPGFSALLDATP